MQGALQGEGHCEEEHSGGFVDVSVFSGLLYLIASVEVFHHLKSIRVGLWQDNTGTHNTGKDEVSIR